MTKNSLLTNYNGSLNLERLGELISKNETTSLKGLFGSSLSFYISTLYKKLSSPFIIVFNSKQEALYFLNDIEILNPNKKIFYYPEISKEPYSELKINNYNINNMFFNNFHLFSTIFMGFSMIFIEFCMFVIDFHYFSTIFKCFQ